MKTKPYLDEKDRKTKRITFLVTASDNSRIVRQALNEGRTVSAYCARVILDRVKQEELLRRGTK
jgi:hypothetical protein